MEVIAGEKYNIKAILKYAGAFMAWVVGSGFATGQEILRFFSSFGYASYGVVLLNLVGFLILGKTMFVVGYDNREKEKFNHYKYYCGNTIGTIYLWLVSAVLVLLMAVLIAGAGATLSEYYGINRFIGSAIVAILVLCTYLIGFEKLIKILAFVGPTVIIFTLIVGTFTVVSDFSNIFEVRSHESSLTPLKAAPHWAISVALYLALNFLSGSTYFTALGKSAKSRSEAMWGAVAGASVIAIVIAIMNTAILLHAGDVAVLAVPTLFLAAQISHVLGAAFSIILVVGIFSSCSTMMWSFCNQFFTGTRKNKVVAVATSIVTFCIGLFPFRELVGVFYPFIGYVGLVFIGCVIYRYSKTRFL